MNYEILLNSKGWKKGPKCGPCTGGKRYDYVHDGRPGEVVEILYVAKLFRYKVNGHKVSGGSINSLQHQHFMQ